MAGRYTLGFPDERDISTAIHEQFAVTNAIEGLPQRFNIAPGQVVPVITSDRSDNEASHLTTMEWGYIPEWCRDASTLQSRPFNARIETALKRRMFSDGVYRRRCAVPATGWYEWQGTDRKTPWYIHPRHQAVLAIAGIYSIYRDEDEGFISTFAMLTMPAVGQMRTLHRRMPVLLATSLAVDSWVHRTTNLKALIARAREHTGALVEDDSLVSYTVGREVGDHLIDHPDLIVH